jgi:hypothetical protein
MGNCLAVGKTACPWRCHKLAMASTAKAAVSAEVPVLTVPRFLSTSWMLTAIGSGLRLRLLEVANQLLFLVSALMIG